MVLVAYKVGKCRLRTIRRRLGWTQVELADKVHKTKQTIHRWETDETIMSYENALNVAKVTGVSMEDLYKIIKE